MKAELRLGMSGSVGSNTNLIQGKSKQTPVISTDEAKNGLVLFC